MTRRRSRRRRRDKVTRRGSRVPELPCACSFLEDSLWPITTRHGALTSRCRRTRTERILDVPSVRLRVDVRRSGDYRRDRDVRRQFARADQRHRDQPAVVLGCRHRPVRIVFVLSARAQTLAPSTASMLFVAYSALTGLDAVVRARAVHRRTGRQHLHGCGSACLELTCALRHDDEAESLRLRSAPFMGLIAGLVLASLVGIVLAQRRPRSSRFLAGVIHLHRAG